MAGPLWMNCYIEIHNYFKLTEISLTEMKFQDILASYLSMTHAVLITSDSHSVQRCPHIIHLLYRLALHEACIPASPTSWTIPPHAHRWILGQQCTFLWSSTISRWRTYRCLCNIVTVLQWRCMVVDCGSEVYTISHAAKAVLNKKRNNWLLLCTMHYMWAAPVSHLQFTNPWRLLPCDTTVWWFFLIWCWNGHCTGSKSYCCDNSNINYIAS